MRERGGLTGPCTKLLVKRKLYGDMGYTEQAGEKTAIECARSFGTVYSDEGIEGMAVSVFGWGLGLVPVTSEGESRKRKT